MAPNNYQRKVAKVLLILEFILCTTLILSLYYNQAKFYEYSIYAYITSVEYFLIIVILMFIILIVWISFSNSLELSKGYFLLVLLVGIVLYSLHVLRGYYFWGGDIDPATHFTYAKFIYTSGSLWMPREEGTYLYYEADYYPLLHIFHAILSMVSLIDLRILHNWLPTYFWIFYLVFTFLTIKLSLKTKFDPYLVLALLLAPIHEWYLNLTANHTYNLMWFPVLLYLGIRGLVESIFRKLFFILLVTSQLWHPLALIVGILLTTVLYLPQNLSFVKKTLVLVFIVFISWMSQFWPWKLFVISTYKLLKGAEDVHTGALSVTGLLDLAVKYGYDPWILTLKLWGLRFIIVGTAGTVLILDLLKKRFKISSTSFSTKYGIGLIVTSVVMGVLFILPIGFSPFRLFYYLLIFGLLYILVTRAQSANSFLASKNKYRLIIIPLLVTIYMISFITLYPSPYNLTPNHQTTKNELFGISWFVFHFEREYQISGTYNLPLGRYLDIISDPYTKSELGYPFTKKYLPEPLALPPHFGYSNSTTICESLNSPTYIILTTRDIVKYLKVAPRLQEFWYTPEDFTRFRIDEQNSIIYSSKDINVYLALCGGKD